MLSQITMTRVMTRTEPTLTLCSFDGKKGSKKNGPILKELERIAEPDVVEWVVEEMAANRQKQVVKDKASNSPAVLLINFQCLGWPSGEEGTLVSGL